MMDKLVVGCGYLGERIARRWHQSDARVFVTTRSEETAERFRQQQWHPVLCDVTRPETLTDLPRVSTVVYCVGLDRSSGQSMHDVYVQGLQNVLDHLPSPERFLYVSSTGVYGQIGGEIVDETSETEPIDDSGRTVLKAERSLHSRVEHAIVLRFAGIYGPDRLLRSDALQKGEVITGVGESWLNLIHVDDGAEAVLIAEERATAGEIYNVSDDEPVRRQDFFGFLAEELGAPEPQFTGTASRRPTNRRIANRRLREELSVSLRYPDYRVGIREVLKSKNGGD